VFENDPIADTDRIHSVPIGTANLQALQHIFAINERALFEWIVSRGSLEEAHEKRDPGHMQWLWDIADHSTNCLEAEGPTLESERLAARLGEPSSAI
jgi:hypothetical protein